MACAVLALISASLVAAAESLDKPLSEWTSAEIFQRRQALEREVMEPGVDRDAMRDEYQRLADEIIARRRSLDRRPSTTAPLDNAAPTGVDDGSQGFAFSSRQFGETAVHIIENGVPCRDMLTQVRAIDMGGSSPVVQIALTSGAIYLAGAASAAKLDNTNIQELMPAFIAFCEADDSRDVNDFVDSLPNTTINCAEG
ncbi:hypothetical protein [Paracoccus sp. (in: a-proteobacteria)]|uniref:hypothetical protein n=1 Tax=Paracoccus sp. TaxID=267 RepID=UPI0026E0E002|nr:hypothetical protein [Paracoccus sp. (in: a-proteobacteria)]MDO5647939.1 hypothetical protein [Paracoccus sp. (in: a-proteobacteria)]